MQLCELSEKIECWLNDFISDQKNPDYIRDYALKFRLLPLYVDWQDCWAINAAGEIFKFSHDNESADLQMVTDAVNRTIALVQGRKKYPELSALIPIKPYGAKLCDYCQGHGFITGLEQIICHCGGSGWLLE